MDGLPHNQSKPQPASNMKIGMGYKSRKKASKFKPSLSTVKIGVGEFTKQVPTPSYYKVSNWLRECIRLSQPDIANMN